MTPEENDPKVLTKTAYDHLVGDDWENVLRGEKAGQQAGSGERWSLIMETSTRQAIDRQKY